MKQTPLRSQVRNSVSLPTFNAKLIILPRQAPDKHRLGKTQKDLCSFPASPLDGITLGSFGHWGGCYLWDAGAKQNGQFNLFHYISHRDFTKTGSGQTYQECSQKRRGGRFEFASFRHVDVPRASALAA